MSGSAISARGAPLSLEDSINLHAATMMSICAALDAAGLVSHDQMAQILAAQARQDDSAPWACIVRAMAGVLAQRAIDQAEVATSIGPPRPSFSIIRGGRFEAELIGRQETTIRP